MRGSHQDRRAITPRGRFRGAIGAGTFRFSFRAPGAVFGFTRGSARFFHAAVVRSPTVALAEEPVLFGGRDPATLEAHQTLRSLRLIFIDVLAIHENVPQGQMPFDVPRVERDHPHPHQARLGSQAVVGREAREIGLSADVVRGEGGEPVPIFGEGAPFPLDPGHAGAGNTDPPHAHIHGQAG